MRICVNLWLIPLILRRVKAECLRLLVTLRLNPAKMQLIFGFVDAYLRLDAEEDQEFRQTLA